MNICKYASDIGHRGRGRASSTASRRQGSSNQSDNGGIYKYV
jgi:hypothetical protein